MTTLAEHIIIARTENHPPMLEKSMYDSWASRIRLFIKGKKNGRMMLDSIDEGPLVYPTVVGEDGQTRPKKYSKLTEAQQLQDDCNVQATNIILHGLSPDVYSLVNHQKAANDIWDRVNLLMKGTELSYQERECRLFSQLINEIHTIEMTMQQVQVNTKFLNVLLPEWSKFVTDVKLAKSLYTTNYDQLYAYLSQHERHANEVRIMRERYPDPLALATIQDGRVTVQQVQRRQTQSFAGTGNRGITTTLRGNYATGQAKLSVRNQDKRKLCKVFSAKRELVDIVNKTLELVLRVRGAKEELR
ncbi:hypothetical protein Tco_0802021 [Tanacetum coccineum]|uniref:Integrase, catalytic region, zinc finger, CCHC-type, peptidase aspartic, catalytic n=1 Tax=Tanacetum coccineum TaxID=301880 RepID=A0ABQ4ZXT3_9ASTR